MKRSIAALTSALLLTACAPDGDDTYRRNSAQGGFGTYERTIGGMAIGAGAGAAVGGISNPGNTGAGILIGAGIGALVGFLYDSLSTH